MGRGHGPALWEKRDWGSAAGQLFLLTPPDLDEELEDREEEELDRADEEERPEEDPPDLATLEERPEEEPLDLGALILRPEEPLEREGAE
jgi:hypothetical protein